MGAVFSVLHSCKAIKVRAVYQVVLLWSMLDILNDEKDIELETSEHLGIIFEVAGEIGMDLPQDILSIAEEELAFLKN